MGGALLDACWNAVMRVRVFVSPFLALSPIVSVCVRSRLSAALCSAADSHLRILAGT